MLHPTLSYDDHETCEPSPLTDACAKVWILAKVSALLLPSGVVT